MCKAQTKQHWGELSYLDSYAGFVSCLKVFRQEKRISHYITCRAQGPDSGAKSKYGRNVQISAQSQNAGRNVHLIIVDCLSK
jgi:hypothetical protein